MRIELGNEVVKVAYQEVERVFRDLSGRQREVLRMRFGIGGSNPLSQSAVASELGVSRSTVRVHELRGLEKIRHPYSRAARLG